MEGAETFGEFFKQKRIKTGRTLRDFCRISGFDPGNVSKLERNLTQPPQRKELRLQYAKALGIEKNSDDWLVFCDLATIGAGKIPADFSEKEVLNALPVLFRAIRKNDLEEEDLRNLINDIRKELR